MQKMPSVTEEVAQTLSNGEQMELRTEREVRSAGKRSSIHRGTELRECTGSSGNRVWYHWNVVLGKVDRVSFI